MSANNTTNKNHHGITRTTNPPNHNKCHTYKINATGCLLRSLSASIWICTTSL